MFVYEIKENAFEKVDYENFIKYIPICTGLYSYNLKIKGI